MALMKCKECGKEISSKAEFCPHCGFVYKKGKGTKKVVFTTIITVFSIIIVLILILNINDCNTCIILSLT